MLMAMASSEAFDLLGVTAVAGNVPLALTESNARRIRDLAGRSEVPVHAGCPRPMVLAPVSAICRASTARGPGTIRGSEPTGRGQF